MSAFSCNASQYAYLFVGQFKCKINENFHDGSPTHNVSGDGESQRLQASTDVTRSHEGLHNPSRQGGTALPIRQHPRTDLSPSTFHPIVAVRYAR